MAEVRETNIREYAEEEEVIVTEHGDRLVVKSYNEGGYNCTEVDLLDIIDWVKANMPELLKETENES